MSHTRPNGRDPARAAKPARAAVIVVLLACLGLAACGGSSKSSTTSTNAAATTASGTGASGPAGRGGGRFKAVRECLQKNGITLPQRTPGAGRPTGPGGFLGGGAAGGPQLPKGVSRAQYEAALKKCGGGAFGGGAARLKNPAYKQALAKFATCMRENGVNVPTPNTSGTGPVFNTKGLNTASAQFKAAETKCSGELRGAFRSRPGAGGTTGAPGAGAGPGGEGGAGEGA
jgi:hypothetical protein